MVFSNEISPILIEYNVNACWVCTISMHSHFFSMSPKTTESDLKYHQMTSFSILQISLFGSLSSLNPQGTDTSWPAVNSDHHYWIDAAKYVGRTAEMLMTMMRTWTKITSHVFITHPLTIAKTGQYVLLVVNICEKDIALSRNVSVSQTWVFLLLLGCLGCLSERHSCHGHVFIFSLSDGLRIPQMLLWCVWNMFEALLL